MAVSFRVMITTLSNIAHFNYLERFNEQRDLSKRSLRFNLQKLLDVAVDVVGNGARSCVKILKCSEGLHNKAFLLTMDNGVEVFAKLPNPNAGPVHYTTLSEIATRDFLREVFHIPVPRIFAWSADPKNPVEAEYIIEEKAPGVRLMVEMENSLASMSFSKHGCIYFKKYLYKIAGDAADLSISRSVAPEVLNRFAIGPLTSAEFWVNGRADMNLDRGPWQNSREYMQAIGRNEIAWIKSHATPRMNYYRSLRDPELPEEALSLLSQYMGAASYLVPQYAEEANSMVFWHPDLHLNNVFCGVPRMFRHTKLVREGWVVPERPADFENLSEDEKRQIDEDLENETIHKYYEAQVYKRAPRHWAVLRQKIIPIIRKPVWLVTGVWEKRDVFLRQSLISLAAHWDELCPNDVSTCPINFSKQELELHLKEDENMDGIGHLLVLFRDQGVLPVDGMVDPKDYEIAKRNSQKFKEVFVELATDDEERELFSKLWPYQDLES
ncbi:MAG: hypothetical protein M1834_006193 [Cirrosporium novae-zelandiae]|nr:MAG: hypothetical protein M1834_006193 [Cirrosporium novae-zelandiae]